MHVYSGWTVTIVAVTFADRSDKALPLRLDQKEKRGYRILPSPCHTTCSGGGSMVSRTQDKPEKHISPLCSTTIFLFFAICSLVLVSSWHASFRMDIWKNVHLLCQDCVTKKERALVFISSMTRVPPSFWFLEITRIRLFFLLQCSKTARFFVLCFSLFKIISSLSSCNYFRIKIMQLGGFNPMQRPATPSWGWIRDIFPQPIPGRR